MQKFWKNQAALNAGDPIALTRLPPELADAAVAQWEQALRLAQQMAKVEDSAARAHLEQLRRDTDLRARSVELREKEWDFAARARTRARRSRISSRGTPPPARDGDCGRDCEEPEDSGQKTATPDSTQAQEASHAKKTSTIETDPTPPSEEENPRTTSVKSLRYCASRRISRLP
jgi:hypothetical protein